MSNSDDFEGLPIKEAYDKFSNELVQATKNAEFFACQNCNLGQALNCALEQKTKLEVEQKQFDENIGDKLKEDIKKLELAIKLGNRVTTILDETTKFVETTSARVGGSKHKYYKKLYDEKLKAAKLDAELTHTKKVGSMLRHQYDRQSFFKNGADELPEPINNYEYIRECIENDELKKQVEKEEKTIEKLESTIDRRLNRLIEESYCDEKSAERALILRAALDFVNSINRDLTRNEEAAANTTEYDVMDLLKE